MEFLFDSVQPLVNLEGLFCLFKDRRLGVQEVLECTELIWLRSLILQADMSNILRNKAQSFFHRSLIPQELRKKTHSRKLGVVVVGCHHYHLDWYQPQCECESSTNCNNK